MVMKRQKLDESTIRAIQLERPIDLDLDPYPVFFLGLEWLNQYNPTTQIGESEMKYCRVFELPGGKIKPFRFYDVRNSNTVLQRGESDDYCRVFRNVREKVLTTVNQDKHEIELRILRVPALYFEALWLHYVQPPGKQPPKDKLMPLTASKSLRVNELVSLQKALSVLKNAAVSFIEQTSSSPRGIGTTEPVMGIGAPSREPSDQPPRRRGISERLAVRTRKRVEEGEEATKVVPPPVLRGKRVLPARSPRER